MLAQEGAVAGKGGSDIMIVDDDDMLRETLVMAVESAGYTVSQASDGRQALDMIDECHPGIVVTDILMPKCDGLEVLQRLREQRADVKVIAMSGGGIINGALCLRLAGAFGADVVLAKPFRPGQLLDAIDKVTHA